MLSLCSTLAYTSEVGKWVERAVHSTASVTSLLFFLQIAVCSPLLSGPRLCLLPAWFFLFIAVSFPPFSLLFLFPVEGRERMGRPHDLHLYIYVCVCVPTSVVRGMTAMGLHRRKGKQVNNLKLWWKANRQIGCEG